MKYFMKLQHQIDEVLLLGLLAAGLVTGCSTTHKGQAVIRDPNLVVPYVEEVRYTKRTTRPASELAILVNAGKGWPGKRDCFGKCDRCSYLLNLPNGTSAYAASDIDIRTSSRPSGPSFHPKHGRITITGSDPTRMAVEVDIDDERVPRLINGSYTLTVDGVCYSMERRQ